MRLTHRIIGIIESEQTQCEGWLVAPFVRSVIVLVILFRERRYLVELAV